MFRTSAIRVACTTGENKGGGKTVRSRTAGTGRARPTCEEATGPPSPPHALAPRLAPSASLPLPSFPLLFLFFLVGARPAPSSSRFPVSSPSPRAPRSWRARRGRKRCTTRRRAPAPPRRRSRPGARRPSTRPRTSRPIRRRPDHRRRCRKSPTSRQRRSSGTRRLATPARAGRGAENNNKEGREGGGGRSARGARQARGAKGLEAAWRLGNPRGARWPCRRSRRETRCLRNARRPGKGFARGAATGARSRRVAPPPVIPRARAGAAQSEGAAPPGRSSPPSPPSRLAPPFFSSPGSARPARSPRRLPAACSRARVLCLFFSVADEPRRARGRSVRVARRGLASPLAPSRSPPARPAAVWWWAARAPGTSLARSMLVGRG